MTKNITLLILLYNTFICISQNDSIVHNKLEEVTIVGKKKDTQTLIGKKSIKVTEKQFTKNPTNFTELLRYNSPIVFKDYGNGGISSARFRGTSATNTLVMWNGISVNAIGNGQVDFNSLSAVLSDDIIINSGGGSAENGSGAIGGTINLKDNLSFKEHQDFQLFTSYGDFNTTSNFFKSNLGTGKWAVKLSSTINFSDNDYTFIDDRYSDTEGNLLVNENGTYKNYGISFSLGYKISDVNKLFFYTTGYYGDRLFSDGLPNPSAGSERNEDFNQRNLLKWKSTFSKFKQEVNLSYLTQEYRYYNDKDNVAFDYGKSNNSNLEYKLNYKANNDLFFDVSTTYQKHNGITESIGEIINKVREVISFNAETIYKPTNTTTTKLSVRKEQNSQFKVPLSLSLGLEQLILEKLTLKGNYSNNYRVPTFNELYWPIVGNLDLRPETSSQGEIGLELNTSKIQLNTALFYIHTNDKILWLPTGNSNLWKPINLNDVVNKGIETFINYTTNIGEGNIKTTFNYLFTIAENIKTNKALPYVPKHIFNINASYIKSWFKCYLQTLYQSKVYTNEINLDFYSLDALIVNNIGIDFKILHTKKKQLTIGTKINNILNSVYYFTNLRPMPGRNYNININYKF